MQNAAADPAAGYGGFAGRIDPEKEARFRATVQEYMDFLDDAQDRRIYSERINQMIQNEQIRLEVNVNDLRAVNPGRCNSLLKDSVEEVNAFQAALRNCIQRSSNVYARNHENFFVGLCGSFGARHVSPRTLQAKLLGGIVCVEGIVTKCTIVRPKIVRSVHYAPKTGKTIERRYTDLMSGGDATSRMAYPTKDDEGNPLETEYGLCVFKDHQMFTIQELPEKAPPGQLPRSVEVVVEDDLVDLCKPGDRVLVVGTYRVIHNQRQGYFAGNFRTVIIANFVVEQHKENAPIFTQADSHRIRKFAQQPDAFEVLARSVAPSIYGNDYVKQAILCLLLGGQEKVLANGTRLRGDVNILLIGDPSVAKSQMLRFVLQIANVAIATTGRGSTGVGLTAAVTTDETGDRRLEAGAMVLADRGVVCIDEFDKMAEEDRTAIHEVMEQGRVTISKAGIHAKLNARCSVLAAANPVYGRYDPYKSPMDNIGMQDSLLSRFDLIFVMTDKADQEQDLILADHVVRMHRYRAAGELDGEPTRLNMGVDWLSTNMVDTDDSDQRRSGQIYEKYDSILHGPRRNQYDKVLSKQFLRKYISIAKNCTPKLTQDACTLIAEEYAKLRSQDQVGADVARTQPVTARALETMIRLATAHAKSRLQRTVEQADAQAACDMVQFALFKKVEKRKKKRTIEEDDHAANGNGAAMDVDEAEVPANGQALDPDDPYRFGSSEPTPKRATVGRGQVVPGRADTVQAAAPAPPTIAADKYKMFKELVGKHFQETRQGSLPQNQLSQHVAEKAEAQGMLYTHAEMEAGFGKMTDEGVILVTDEQVFLI
ncbi:zygotic DNA replication licensing factor mcm3-like [Paramacrobiotus metropolitanus]|uniref:zygotic DNA replication licensing factor mcm3-like n=1 Tax=Paramacrobiotus metropolitanus TaxID=2943436 RepID=UPI0024464717|nr:zygotic DNA replication licensing factor mcm3-like [Paramacrobiotus metropolitanus]